jgi:hypothetical protein
VAENTAKKQRGRPFSKGQSGNPKGRPPGALNQSTRVAQSILDGEEAALTRKAVELAQAGNVVALRLCLERLLPPRKERPINFALPRVENAQDLPQALAAILAAVAQGDITPGEGQTLVSMLEAYRKGLENSDLDARLTALEKQRRHGQH